MAAARNHHYVPQAYLGVFTDTGTSEGHVWAYDISGQRSFHTTPRNVASERDFNRVDIDGERQDVLEQIYGRWESQAAIAIRSIAESGRVDSIEDLSVVINLLCLLIVRNPKARQTMLKSKEQLVKSLTEIVASRDNILKDHWRKAIDSGLKPISYEEFKELITQQISSVEFPRQSLIRTELSVFDDVLSSLAARRWSLMVAATDAPDFITCDHPFAITFKNSDATDQIGMGSSETELFFPITARHAVFGVFENFPPSVQLVGTSTVGEMNRRIMGNANRQIFSRTPVVSLLGRDGSFMTIDLRNYQRRSGDR